jgi:DNA-binding transcriptional regulator YdaS (Cro superfamily)
MSTSPMQRAVDQAARRYRSKRALAKRLGICHQALSCWERVPARHCLAMEEMSGVSRYELRPDIYGPAPVEPPAENEDGDKIAA